MNPPHHFKQDELRPSTATAETTVADLPYPTGQVFSTRPTAVPSPAPTPMKNFTPLPAPRNGVRYKIATYERVSRPIEVTGSHTFDTQLPAIERKLDLVYGADKYELVNFCDNGVSGGYGANPSALQRRTRASFSAMWKRVKAGEFDAVAAYDLSRLYRRDGIHHQFVEEVLLPSETDLILVTMDLNIRTPAGKLIASVISSVNTNYLDACGERSSAASQTRRELGYVVGPPPFGWRYTPHRDDNARRGFEPDPEAKAVVLTIRERYMAGANVVTIAKELNAQGIVAPAPKKGKPPHPKAKTRTTPSSRHLIETPVGLWTNSSVLQVLNQPCHAGLMYARSKKKGGLVPGRHFEARFYEPADYEAIQQRIGARILRTNAAKANSRNWLAGLLFCQRCGQPLNRFLGAIDARIGDYPYRAYRCSTGYAQGQPTCPDVSVSAYDVE